MLKGVPSAIGFPQCAVGFPNVKRRKIVQMQQNKRKVAPNAGKLSIILIYKHTPLVHLYYCTNYHHNCLDSHHYACKESEIKVIYLFRKKPYQR